MLTKSFFVNSTYCKSIINQAIVWPILYNRRGESTFFITVVQYTLLTLLQYSIHSSHYSSTVYTLHITVVLVYNSLFNSVHRLQTCTVNQCCESGMIIPNPARTLKKFRIQEKNLDPAGSGSDPFKKSLFGVTYSQTT